MRELVKECRSELVCCREEALAVVLLALDARDLSGGSAKGNGGRDEVALLRGVELVSSTTFPDSTLPALVELQLCNKHVLTIMFFRRNLTT